MSARSRSNARFTIEGTASTSRGFDALSDQVLSLQLEAQPPLDTRTCVYTVKRKSPNAAPDPVLANGGVASPVGGSVALTCPSSGVGAVSYLVRCQTNEGEAVRAADGSEDWTVNTFERIVSIRTISTGLRLILVGETSEYDPLGGWVQALNEIALQMEALQLQMGTLFGFAFPAGGTFLITQTTPGAGVVPKDALIHAQDAHPGDLLDGGGLTLRGGLFGDQNDNHNGPVTIDLGDVDFDTTETARFFIDSLSTHLETIYWDSSTVFWSTASSRSIAAGGSSLLLTCNDGVGAAAMTLASGANNSVSLNAKRVYTSGQRVPTVGNQSVAGNFTIDFDVKGDSPKITLTADATITSLIHVQEGTIYVIQVVQSGGPWLLTWGSSVKFGGVSSALTSSAGAIDIFAFRGDAGGILRFLSVSRGVHV